MPSDDAARFACHRYDTVGSERDSEASDVAHVSAWLTRHRFGRLDCRTSSADRRSISRPQNHPASAFNAMSGQTRTRCRPKGTARSHGQRDRELRCLECGYDLHDRQLPCKCSECGTPMTAGLAGGLLPWESARGVGRAAACLKTVAVLLCRPRRTYRRLALRSQFPVFRSGTLASVWACALLAIRAVSEVILRAIWWLLNHGMPGGINGNGMVPELPRSCWFCHVWYTGSIGIWIAGWAATAIILSVMLGRKHRLVGLASAAASSDRWCSSPALLAVWTGSYVASCR